MHEDHLKSCLTYPPQTKAQRELWFVQSLQLGRYKEPDNDLRKPFLASPEKSTTYGQELSSLLEICIPVAIATVSRIIIYSTDVAFVGHIGKEAMNAVSLAYAIEGLLSGIAKAPALILNQLCSQAIGAGNPKLASVWFQIAEVVSFPFCIVSVFVVFHVGEILSWMYNDELLIDYGTQFGHVGFMILVLSIQYGIIRQFLQGIFIVKPAMYVSILFTVLNFAANYYFIYTLGLGFIGAPIATSASFFGQIACLTAYVFLFRQLHIPYWTPWSKENFTSDRLQSFWTILRPKMTENFMRVAGDRFISFLGGLLSATEFASLVIANQVYWMYWSFYWGLGLACQIRVGRHIGNGNLHALRVCINVALSILTPIAVFICINNYIFRYQIASIFVADKETIDATARLGLIISLHFFFDAQKILSNDILSGMSRNNVVMWINTLEMWCIKMPFMVYVVKVSDWKNKTQWILWSQVLSAMLAAFASWTFLFYTDVETLSLEARKRAEKYSKESST